MDPLTTARRLSKIGAVRTVLMHCYRDADGKPSSRPRLVPRCMVVETKSHVVSVEHNGGMPDALLERAHVRRHGDESDPYTDYFPGCWTNLKHAIAMATRA